MTYQEQFPDIPAVREAYYCDVVEDLYDDALGFIGTFKGSPTIEYDATNDSVKLYQEGEAETVVFGLDARFTYYLEGSYSDDDGLQLTLRVVSCAWMEKPFNLYWLDGERRWTTYN